MTIKLTADDKRLMRLLLAERDRLRTELSELTNEKIGERFDVSAHTVSSENQKRMGAQYEDFDKWS
jgi:hypothetical protein